MLVLMHFFNIFFGLVGSQRPTYPSSKVRSVDWDKLEAEVKKEVCWHLLVVDSCFCCSSSRLVNFHGLVFFRRKQRSWMVMQA